MSFRLVEVILPAGNEKVVEELVKDLKIEQLWQVKVSEKRTMSRILIPSGESEHLLDSLDKRFSHVEGFQVMVFSIAASLPRPKEEEKQPEHEPKEQKKIDRINREELYNGIADTAKLTKVYIVTVALSVIVASIGLVRDNVAVIIGAMVIAPLLGPNMALSLATTLADVKLARISMKTLALGVLLAVALAVVLGYGLNADPNTAEIYSRTNVGLGDIGLALASGCAGALFLTIGVSTALVGVMLAVSLLPPLVVFGLLIGSGDFDMAANALILFSTNLICVNLAGVLTFVAQGVRPRSWWEADKAKKLTLWAVLIWCVLLVLLALLIQYSNGYKL
jgi:uncharacterized hydrophobic protein (TIGR00341 family)